MKPKRKLLEKLLLPSWYTGTRELLHKESQHTARAIAQCAETLASAQTRNVSEQGRNAWMVRTPRGWETVECEVRA